jgi:CubicO group peptidase (beta-lactamase class C family)
MSRLERFREQARREMDDLGVPGVAVGVLADGEQEAFCLGVTSRENPLEVTADTLFQVGSITKTYVAALVVRLVERESLELDGSVRTYLPEFRLADERAAEGATIRHLLTHTGGWVGDVFEDHGRGEDALARMVARLADAPQVTPLGEVWSYNNAGFYILGRVIEVVTGQAFEAAMRELVVEPLGLESTFFFPDEVITYRLAVGHLHGEEGDKQAAIARDWWVGRASHPAGGIVQSLNDLLRYGRHAFDGRPLLTPESFEQLRQPQVPVGGDVDAVGLAWMLRRIGDVDFMLHGGGTNGQISILYVAPEEKFAFAALTNHDFGGVLIDRLQEPLLEEYLGVREPEPELRVLEPADLAEYAGVYRSWMSDVEVVVSDGGLELRYVQTRGFPTPDAPIPPPPPPAKLAFYEDDRAIATDDLWKGSRMVFLRDADEDIAWVRAGSRLHRRT